MGFGVTKCANRGGIELLRIPELGRKFHYTFQIDEQVTLEIVLYMMQRGAAHELVHVPWF